MLKNEFKNPTENIKKKKGWGTLLSKEGGNAIRREYIDFNSNSNVLFNLIDGYRGVL